MFSNMSVRIADKFIEKHIITAEDREIYQYGFQQFFSVALNLITMIAIGIAFGMVLECIAFLAAYMPLRSFACGFHAKTAVRCYIYSIIMIVIVLSIMKFAALGGIIVGCMSGIGYLILILLAPIEDGNKPLDEKEQVRYRFSARCILFVEILIQLIAAILKWNSIVLCIAMSISTLSFVVILGAIKNYVRNTKSKIV